jgi:hypothetical protein
MSPGMITLIVILVVLFCVIIGLSIYWICLAQNNNSSSSKNVQGQIVPYTALREATASSSSSNKKDSNNEIVSAEAASEILYHFNQGMYRDDVRKLRSIPERVQWLNRNVPQQLYPIGKALENTGAAVWQSLHDASVTLFLVFTSAYTGSAYYYGGSGFFISADGFIVTAAHNVIWFDYTVQAGTQQMAGKLPRASAVIATVTNYNGTGQVRSVYCDIVGTEGCTDIALIKVRDKKMSNQTFMRWGDSRKIFFLLSMTSLAHFFWF